MQDTSIALGVCVLPSFVNYFYVPLDLVGAEFHF
jgi:hypothetical protein